MRIAMFTNNYKPYIGGVPVSIEHLAEALRKRGHAVYVFAPSYEGQEEEPFVIRYPSFPLKIAGAPAPNVLTGLFFEQVKKLGIDIIHVHHPAIVGNVALSIKRKLGIPVMFTYHTRYEEYLHYISVLERIEKHTGMIDRYVRDFCNRCDMIAAPVPEIRDHLIEKGVEVPIGLLPTGISEEDYKPDAKEAARLRRAYIGTADYLFCTVSRLAKEKNLLFQMQGLLHLKRALAQKGKSFRHLMIGEGPGRGVLEAEIRRLGLSENVILVGNKKNAEIKNYHAASDLFLFTSRSETQGVALLEAMAAGSPVVAVEASGVRDIVDDGENGRLTSVDPQEWANAILAAVSEDGKIEKMSRGAKETALQYAEGRVAEQAEIYYLNTCVRAAQTLKSSGSWMYGTCKDNCRRHGSIRNVFRKVPLWH